MSIADRSPVTAERGSSAGGLVLLGHGSPDPEGLRELAALAAAVARHGAMAVEVGCLEFARPSLVPSIGEAIDRCVAHGARRIAAVPLLLFAAAHAKRDMPREVELARARHPGAEIVLAEPLGDDPRLLEIVEERIAEAAPGPPADDAAVLLVGRGTRDPDANAELFRLGRLIWERRRAGLVECAFGGLAWPDATAGLERCIRLGARRIVVVPYLLQTGVFVRRVAAAADEVRGRHADRDIRVARHLGVHPRLVEVIFSRAIAALAPTERAAVRPV